MRRIFSTVLIFTLFATSVQALDFPWWPFGGRDKQVSPSIQTEEARPYYDRALEAERNGKERRAMRNYKKIYEDYPAAQFAGDALFRYGVLQYDRKKWVKSFEAFQKVLIFHPDFPRFNEIIEYQFRISLALAEGDGVRLLLVIPYKAENRAIAYFEAIISNAPYSDLAPLALMNIALIHQHKDNIAEAIDALDRLINNYPNSLLADDAYLTLAETFADLVQGPEYDQGATREAISYFEDFLILFSQNQEVARAETGLEEMEDVYSRSKLILGQYYFKYRRWYEAAEIFFNEAITTAPNSNSAETAREYLARIEAIRNNQPIDEDSPSRKEEKNFIQKMFGKLFS